jgi:hypothetical protein
VTALRKYSPLAGDQQPAVTVPQPDRRPGQRDVPAGRVPDVVVDDQLERRIRKPVDLLRCIMSCTEVIALAVAGVAASATTTGAETDIVGASKRLPHSLLTAAPPLALLALLLYPIIWVLLLPFRLAGIAVDGALGLVREIILLPVRALRGARRA